MIIDYNPQGCGCEGGSPYLLFNDWLVKDSVRQVKASSYPYKAVRNLTPNPIPQESKVEIYPLTHDQLTDSLDPTLYPKA